ncbi:hypothetical protein FOPE_02351 [Fonsecaea pedrosoi]|nr:hypothetical protein FOPE_02351 [Fonsecaea pedrosoi]
MQNSVNLLKDLLDQWTTLADETNHANGDISNASRNPGHIPFSEDLGRQSSGSTSKSANPGEATRSHEPSEHATTTYGPTANSPDARYTNSIAEKYAASQKKIAELEDKLREMEREKSRMKGNEEAQTRRPANFEDTNSDMDDIEIRPSMKSPQSKTASYFDRPAEKSRISPRTERVQDLDDERWKINHRNSRDYMRKAANRRAERPRISPRTERVQDLDEDDFDKLWERHHQESQDYLRKAVNRPAERPRISPRTERAQELDEDSDERWERHHQESLAYMHKAANRPALDRYGSDAYEYWNGSVSRGDPESSSDNKRGPVYVERRIPPFTDKSRTTSTR